MKKKIAIGMLLTFCMSIVAGCGGGAAQEPAADAEGDGSWQRVVDAGKITAGLDDQYEPMGFYGEDGELTGFDIEMAGKISEIVGVPIEFQPAEWASIVPSLQSGKFDTIISGMNAWEERREQVDFVCYGTADQVLLVKADFADMDALKEQGIEYFLDKKLGGQAGSTGVKNAVSHGFVEGDNLLTYATFPAVVLDMQTDRLDAMIVDSFLVRSMIESNDFLMQAGDPVYDITNGEEAGKEEAYIGIAVRKEDKELQAKLQEAVDQLIADGTITELSEKWIGVDITENM